MDLKVIQLIISIIQLLLMIYIIYDRHNKN